MTAVLPGASARIRVPATETPAVPDVVAHLAVLAVQGRLDPATAAVLHRALVCPAALVEASRLAALAVLTAPGCRYDDPAVAEVLAAVLTEVCPGFAPSLLADLYRHAPAALSAAWEGDSPAVDAAIAAWWVAARTLITDPARLVHRAVTDGLVIPVGDQTVLLDGLTHSGEVQARRLALAVLADHAPDWCATPEGAAEVAAVRWALAPSGTSGQWAELLDAVAAANDPMAGLDSRDTGWADRAFLLDQMVGVRDVHGRRLAVAR